VVGGWTNYLTPYMEFPVQDPLGLEVMFSMWCLLLCILHRCTAFPVYWSKLAMMKYDHKFQNILAKSTDFHQPKVRYSVLSPQIYKSFLCYRSRVYAFANP
jgi:hypothetical protein